MEEPGGWETGQLTFRNNKLLLNGKSKLKISQGQWHGKRQYFGLHYDLHGVKDDTLLGTRCGERELVATLKLVNPDFVQTDCKGHPGYTSWFSRTPGASVPPGLKKDALKQWRAATRKLGLPLHCHYSGIWDAAAGAKHPGWAVVGANGKPVGSPSGTKGTNERMCPRSPYLDELMIPQMRELVDRYGVNGFWIDGDLWGVEPCYCPNCRKAFTEQTGIKHPPTKETDPRWPRWWTFTLESFEEYVTRYCDAVHRHKPGVLVCSNWLQTFNHPGAPHVPTDWISGDNPAVGGLDGSRCEARFISTRGKPWDIMLWGFYPSHPTSPHTAKPVQMLMQEAAMLLAFGGSVQVYEHPADLRDGRLIPWRMKRLGVVGRFVKQRRMLCQDGVTIPQIAVLHSEHHIRATNSGRNLHWTVDTSPVKGAVFAILENHFGVDILDEWALRPRLAEFPLVVVPEQHALSDDMVAALKNYVRAGGKLMVSGAESFARFGSEFLGVRAGKLAEKATFHVPAADGSVPLFSEKWRLLEVTEARSLASLGRTPLLKDLLLANPAATIHQVGRGSVIYVPAAVFRDFERNRYPLTRVFIGTLVRRLAGRLDIEVHAPLCVDVTLRRKNGNIIIHLVNRASGIPNHPNNGVIDEIPRVGPVTITVKTRQKPKSVSLAFEQATLRWKHADGKLTVTVPEVHIHAAVVVA